MSPRKSRELPAAVKSTTRNWLPHPCRFRFRRDRVGRRVKSDCHPVAAESPAWPATPHEGSMHPPEYTGPCCNFLSGVIPSAAVFPAERGIWRGARPDPGQTVGCDAAREIAVAWNEWSGPTMSFGPNLGLRITRPESSLVAGRRGTAAPKISKSFHRSTLRRNRNDPNAGTDAQ